MFSYHSGMCVIYICRRPVPLSSHRRWKFSFPRPSDLEFVAQTLNSRYEVEEMGKAACIYLCNHLTGMDGSSTNALIQRYMKGKSIGHSLSYS
jgi:hypothetical protein